jgi:ubiquinone/menaquinone biosynthesis C-methylase UbiE
MSTANDGPSAPQTPPARPRAGETQQDAYVGTDPADHQFEEALQTIRHRFDISAVLNQDINEESVTKYYNVSNRAYRLLHSKEGAIHMALNYDGRFDQEGYVGQAQLVEEHLSAVGEPRILELASGQGYNSIYLARQHPQAEIYGFDLTQKHVEFAERRARFIANVRCGVANFEELPVKGNSFDVVFVVESICHAVNMRRALEESYRVLRPGGKLIVFDAFRTDTFDSLPDHVQLAARLTEKSMAVGKGLVRGQWVALAESVGFTMTESKNLSSAVMPNLLRLQRLALRFFNHPIRAKLISAFLPAALVQNAIAGLLMPLTVRSGAHAYTMFVLQRPKSFEGTLSAHEDSSNSEYSYRRYGTTTKDYPTWIDRIVRALRLTPTVFAISAAALVFVVGLAAAISIGFSSTYVGTAAIWIGLAGIIWTILAVIWGSSRIHVMYEHLRPVFLISDREYLARLRLWASQFSDTRGAVRASGAIFIFALVLCYFSFYRFTFMTHFGVRSVRPIWFPRGWYDGRYVVIKMLIVAWYGLAVSALLGTTGRLLILNIRLLYSFRTMPVVPLATVVRSRLREITNFYVLTSLAWTGGVALFALLFVRRVDALALAFTITLGIVGFLTFLVPQFVFRSYLIAGYGGLCTWALLSFYRDIGTRLDERPPLRMPATLERFYDMDRRQPEPSTPDAAASIADLVSATASTVTWVYDSQDIIALAFGQGIAILSITWQALAFFHTVHI